MKTFEGHMDSLPQERQDVHMVDEEEPIDTSSPLSRKDIARYKNGITLLLC